MTNKDPLIKNFSRKSYEMTLFYNNILKTLHKVFTTEGIHCTEL